MSADTLELKKYQFEELSKHSLEFRADSCYPSDIIEKFIAAKRLIDHAAIYIHNIDLLVSCDNGPDSFRKSLFDDLKKLYTTE